MSALLDRARVALAPAYEVEASLGVGGMGEVFRARDVALDRSVAIKVLRPEVATAINVERFIREARLLARLAHTNIVPVYHAGEAQGLYYFVMELQSGETLERRLEAGPLPPDEAMKVAREVLSGLGAAHGAGVIHRDIKPSNIFLAPAGARLGDFGISHDQSDPGLTATGSALGTVAYMAPEQRAGLPSTDRTDLHATGAVLYECLSGRRWVETPDDWSRVPQPLVPAIRRALEHEAGRRWPDARSFVSALNGAALLLATPDGPSGNRRAWAVAGAIASIPVGVVLWSTCFAPESGRGGDPGGPPPPPVVAAGPMVVGFSGFTADTSNRPLVLAERQFRRRLREAGVGFAEDDGAAAPTLTLTASTDGGAEDLGVTLGARGSRGDLLGLHVARRGTAGEAAALGDSLAADALRELWRFENSDSLPSAALPHRPGAVAAWFAAERHFGRAEWNDARQGYERALREDIACAFCQWRLQLIARWYQVETGPDAARRLAGEAGRFPDPFRSLILAAVEPFPDRIGAHRAVRDRFPNHHLAQFLYGDEVLHRGPLDGIPRRVAADAFGRAAQLRPGFIPAWEHRAWLEISEGNAAAAMAALERLGPGVARGDPFAVAMAALLRTAATWRFAGPEEGRALLDTLLAMPGIAESEFLATAPRFLVSFGTPDGAVELARRFLDGRFAGYRPAAAYARAFAFTAMGRPDSALAAFGALSDPADAARWRALLAVASALADPSDTAAARRAAAHRPSLAALATDRRAPSALAREGAWLLALLDGTPAAAPAGPHREFAEADALARRGNHVGALARTDRLHALEARSNGPGPFFRALLHLRRGAWREAAGDAVGARAEWTWSENQDVEGNLQGAPVSAEADWAFGTLALWRRAESGRASAGSGSPEIRARACADYAEVARLWKDAELPARVRADSALATRDVLGCGT
jgi:hypothetical protein